MPVHNGEKYLRKAMESILNQSFRDFEFLIIDDGSSDTSAEIIRSYRDNRIKLVENESNLGLIETLNKGIKLAQGEFVARMDCDDFSLPNRLAEQTAYMERNRLVGICGSWILVQGEKEFINRYPLSHEEICCGLLFETMFAHPSVMIRREAFLCNGLTYDSAYRHAEDYELWVRSAKLLKLANIPKVLLHYRLHPGQVSSQKLEEQRRLSIEIRSRLIRALGIVPSQEDMALHESICRQERRLTEESVAAAESWLYRLMEANRKSSYFMEPAFSKTLAERWFKICKRTNKAWGRKAFWSSPLSRVVKPKFLGWWRLRYAMKYDWRWT